MPLGIVVGHTHWDREWYLPFEAFRARLVAMLDNLLDYLEADPAFRCFVLDGQAIMVEDYLEVRPEAEPRVRALAQQDRLKIGPWYTAVDTFLPDPESLVRNLQVGRWSARRWGGREMQIGHLPDTFGFIGQLPQLLNHFGLRDGFAWRGFHPIGGSAACWWESPDGSQVLLMRPAEGYCEGLLGVTDPERFLEEALPGILRYQDEEPYADRLFVIGCDHLPASARLPWLAEQIAERVGHPVEVGPLEAMAARLRADPVAEKLPRIHGEQRDPCLAVCPASITGTRIPHIKQANQRVEALLLGLAEPLQALSVLNGGGADRAHLRWAWRLLAQNHPHDSIPGCSTDTVHREMGVRFERAAAVARDAAQRGAQRLAATLDPSARGELGVIGLVGLVGGRCRVRVRLHAEPDRPFPAFRLVATDGHEVPHVVVDSGREQVRYRLDQDRFANEGATEVVHLAVTADWLEAARRETNRWEMPFQDVELEIETPRAGYTTLRIEPAAEPSRDVRARQWRPASRGELSNGEVRVWLGHDGIYVEDSRTRRRSGPFYFSHAGDSGDEYTANPIDEPPVLFWPSAAEAEVSDDTLGQLLRVPLRAEVPAQLAASRRHREGRVRLDGEALISLNGRRVDLTLRLDNQARDFDLRLIARVPDGRQAHAGVPFGVEQRQQELDHTTPGAPQLWIPDFPFRGWLAVQGDDGTGLALFARGLYEAAFRWASGGGIDIALTLLRGVGWLSRDDLRTRPGHAGPELATPEAQCPGPQEWEIALLPFGELDRLPVASEQFLRPAVAFPIQHPEGSGPAFRSVGNGLDERAVISALRPADSFDGAMLHAHNATAHRLAAEAAGRRARLDETALDDARDGLGRFEIGAWQLERN